MTPSICFNRTFMELKPLLRTSFVIRLPGFNRTFMELKLFEGSKAACYD